MTRPLATIIIPSYNRAGFITETLNSVCNQTYNNWECVIVDDGSSDSTQEIVRKYTSNDNRFKLFQRNKEPKGAPACRNIGIRESHGDFIIFLDSDDLLTEFCLERRLKLMLAHTELAFAVFPMAYFFHQIGDSIELWHHHNMSNPLSGFLRSPQWAITSPIWRKSYLLDLNGFDESLHCWQDWELHIRALTQGGQFLVTEGTPDCYCRRGHYSINSQPINKNKLLSQFDAMKLAYQHLQKGNYLSTLNRRLLASQYLVVACRFYELGEISLAHKSWTTARQLSLMSAYAYNLGKLYYRGRTKVSTNSLFTKIFRKIYSTFLLPDIVWQY